MSYALIQNGAVVEYPYSFRKLRLDNPNTSFPKEPDDARLAELGVFKVATVPMPVGDLTENIVEGAPAFVGGEWTQTWDAVAATPEEIAQRQLEAAQAAEREQVKIDAAVDAFINATPQQILDYVENTATNLIGARTVLKRLALMLHVLARREFG